LLESEEKGRGALALPPAGEWTAEQVKQNSLMSALHSSTNFEEVEGRLGA